MSSSAEIIDHLKRDYDSLIAFSHEMEEAARKADDLCYRPEYYQSVRLGLLQGRPGLIVNMELEENFFSNLLENDSRGREKVIDQLPSLPARALDHLGQVFCNYRQDLSIGALELGVYQDPRNDP